VKEPISNNYLSGRGDELIKRLSIVSRRSNRKGAAGAVPGFAMSATHIKPRNPLRHERSGRQICPLGEEREFVVHPSTLAFAVIKSCVMAMLFITLVERNSVFLDPGMCFELIRLFSNTNAQNSENFSPLK
jgi:hypothetical protein